MAHDPNILTFSVKRVMDGTRIYAKSEIIEQFFRKIALLDKPRIKCPKWTGVSLYQLPPHILEDQLVLDYAELNSPGDETPQGRLVLGDRANLTFLRHDGLGSGLSFLIPGVCSDKYLEDYLSMAKKGLNELYSGYIRPFEVEVIITSEVRKMTLQPTS